MEKIVILTLVILSYVALSSADHHSINVTSVPEPSPSMPHPVTTVHPPAPGEDETTTAPTSGAVSFSASAGLIVSLILALLH